MQIKARVPNNVSSSNGARCAKALPYAVTAMATLFITHYPLTPRGDLIPVRTCARRGREGRGRSGPLTVANARNSITPTTLTINYIHQHCDRFTFPLSLGAPSHPFCMLMHNVYLCLSVLYKQFLRRLVCRPHSFPAYYFSCRCPATFLPIAQ